MTITPNAFYKTINSDITTYQQCIEKRMVEGTVLVRKDLSVRIIYRSTGDEERIPAPNAIQCRLLEEWLKGHGWSVVTVTPDYDWTVELTPEDTTVEMLFPNSGGDKDTSWEDVNDPKEMLRRIYPLVYTTMWLRTVWNDHNHNKDLYVYVQRACDKLDISRLDRGKAEALLEKIEELTQQ